MYTLPPDIHVVMMGPRLFVTFDEGTEIPVGGEEKIEVLRPKLESPEVIQHIIDECYLLDDKEHFNGNETFVFNKVEYRGKYIAYSFINADKDIVMVKFLIDYHSSVI